MNAAWQPKQKDEIPFPPGQHELYRRRESYFPQFPLQRGRNKRGEFAVAVACKYYRDLGYTVWLSEPELPGRDGYMLVTYPGKRRARHPALVRMFDHFPEEVIHNLNIAADRAKQSATGNRDGGDPDLFVFRDNERFFVEVKWDKWRDSITPKQSATFPLIEQFCQAEIRLAKVHELDVENEIDRYFDPSSSSGQEQPRIAVITGAPAVGKTTFRREHYSSGYVLVDAAEVFVGLQRDRFLPFPGPFRELLDTIGQRIANRAFTERRHVVTELIGADLEPVQLLAEAMRRLGYRVEGQVITCDVEEALRNNEARGENDISCFYAEPFQREWLLAAAHAALKGGGLTTRSS